MLSTDEDVRSEGSVAGVLQQILHSSPTADPGNLPQHWLRLRKVLGTANA